MPPAARRRGGRVDRAAAELGPAVQAGAVRLQDQPADAATVLSGPGSAPYRAGAPEETGATTANAGSGLGGGGAGAAGRRCTGGGCRCSAAPRAGPGLAVVSAWCRAAW